MHINGLLSVVVSNHLVLYLANTADRALKDLLDEDPLLWVNTLIVTLFKLPVDINVLDVKYSEILEDLFTLPLLPEWLASFIFLKGLKFILDLFL